MIPITIVTGFLGSGKTTLVNNLLSGNHGLKIAIVENEFGATSIDAHLIERSTEELIEVSNGCMCCMVRKDWIDAIERLLDSGKEIDNILIEASGVSDPVAIAQSFLMNDMNGRVKLDSIICLIDGLNYETLLQEYTDTALGQLEFADFVIINKCDLITNEKKTLITTLIRRVNAHASILETSYGKMDPHLFFDTNRFEKSTLSSYQKNTDGESHTKEAGLETFCYTTSSRFAAPKLDAFFEDLTSDCYRIKGFIEFEERPGEWWIVQKAGARMSMDPWTKDIPQSSEIVFIGKNMDESLLRKLLDETTESGRSVLFTQP